MTDAPDTQRVMPQPWFRANASAGPIAEIARPGRAADPYRVANPALGERQLGPYVLPPFQRMSVWTRDQQVKLIESIWDGIPIGAYTFNMTTLDDPCDGWLLDGQQRITAILSYVEDGFSVYGYLFSQISLSERRGFMMRPVGTLTTNITDPAQCREVYDRLAYGGTAHTPEQYA